MIRRARWQLAATRRGQNRCRQKLNGDNSDKPSDSGPSRLPRSASTAGYRRSAGNIRVRHLRRHLPGRQPRPGNGHTASPEARPPRRGWNDTMALLAATGGFPFLAKFITFDDQSLSAACPTAQPGDRSPQQFLQDLRSDVGRARNIPNPRRRVLMSLPRQVSRCRQAGQRKYTTEDSAISKATGSRAA